MKKTNCILAINIWAILFLSMACEPKSLEIEFEDVEKFTIYDYMIQNVDQYSSFLEIAKKGGSIKPSVLTIPMATGIPYFCPPMLPLIVLLDENENYSTLQDLLNDEDYLWYFCRYHVVNEGIDANDFPFGAFSEFTLTDDNLAVSFIHETDTSYYKINNQAPVIRPNIELSNGFVHIISKALTPITQTTYEWISVQSGYTLFKAAVDTTGLKSLLDINPKTDEGPCH